MGDFESRIENTVCFPAIMQGSVFSVLSVSSVAGAFSSWLALEIDDMQTSSVCFAQLRPLLLDLHFAETRTDAYWRFEHPESGAVFVFRPYAPEEDVTVQDLATTRTHLVWRGLLSANAFDDSLRKTPA